MNSQPRIAILLSTYNGEKYLAQQLDSIFNQSYQNFLIVVRDDCSSDSTVPILNGYGEKNSEKMILLARESENRGASQSFSMLLDYVLDNKSKLGLVNAYMMFCDQDDIWHGNKIEQQLNAMLQAEAGDHSKPVLVHSDLEVVDQQMLTIAPSLIRFQGLEIERNRFNNVVISNLVTGCTALINESLAKRASPISTHAIMHDWWLAMIAAAFGKLVFLDQPLVRYRQHTANTIGAREHTKLPARSLKRWRRSLISAHRTHLLEVADQADEFRQRYGSQLSFKQRVGLRLAACMSIKIGILQSLIFRLARRF